VWGQRVNNKKIFFFIPDHFLKREGDELPRKSAPVGTSSKRRQSPKSKRKRWSPEKPKK
jgi:hypothetical protein